MRGVVDGSVVFSDVASLQSMLDQMASVLAAVLLCFLIPNGSTGD